MALADGFSIFAITGPCRSGKTTLARSAFGDLRHINLKVLDTREPALADPRRFCARSAMAPCSTRYGPVGWSEPANSNINVKEPNHALPTC